MRNATLPLSLAALVLALLLPANAADAQSIVTSANSNRSAPIPLAGAVVSGSIHVFTTPDTGVSRVIFWLDDPAMAGSPYRTENNGPFDFNGGTVANANPYDTDNLSDGSHTITARLELSGGGVTVLHSTFTVANNLPSLLFSSAATSATLDPGQMTTLGVSLTTSDGNPVTPTLADNASWLTLDAPAGPTPFAIGLDIDATGLAAGTHVALVTAQAPGFESATLAVTLVVNGPAPAFQLLVSPNANRSAAVSLAGQVLGGDIHVFTGPDAGVSRVRFWIDNPALSGTPYRTENTAPYDLNGGSVSLAAPYDTGALSDGAHTISARLDLSAGGSVDLHAAFTVANGAALLDFSAESISTSLDLDAQQSVPVDLVTSTGAPANFTITGLPGWLAIIPGASGTTPAALQLEFDSTGLAYGTYSADLQATAPGFLPANLPVTLVVAPGVPRQVHLAWVGAPSTTLTVVWQTSTNVPSTAEYRLAGGTTWTSVSGAVRNSGTVGVLHEATLSGLQPGTAYEYRVLGDSAWSDPYTARTAPSPGPADFEAIYFADTGIIGRLDGLTTGTAQVIDEIAALDPLLVLAGGDYAYFNTDTRFATLDEAIDAWFEQMEPIASRAVLMPTYGNHEVFLGEGYDSWAQRFPTPSGFDGRRNYSFRVGDVQFISVFAAQNNGGLRPNTAAWLDAEMTAAETSGARWIIPFLHVAPFADGANHPSSLTLRAELGPLFEAHDVHVVLTSHDQSYERTFPLVGVPNSITPTSTGPSCYTVEDGITWVKVSPAGKLSNQNGDFSQWLTNPAPSWTAFRNNTLHHFARISVTADGILEVTIHGVVGDGSAPVIVDTFRYTLGNCPGELQLGTQQLAFSVEEGDAESLPLPVSTSDGTTVPFTVQSSASWLSANVAAGTTPQTLTVTADSAGLPPGTYSGSITVSADGMLPITALASLTVNPAGYSIRVSTASNRSNSVLLDGEVVAGNIFVFTSPDLGVTQVRFYVDNPAASGTPFRTENTAPYDLAGGSVSTATPFDTTSLPDGQHTITAAIVQGTTTSVFHALFSIANTAPALSLSAPSLALSADADGPSASGSVLLSTSGPVANYAVAIPPADTWLTVAPPNGATPQTLVVTADPAGLAPGNHSSTVTITAPGFSPTSLAVSFQVIDDTPALLWNVASLAFTEPEGGAAPPDQMAFLSASEGTAATTIVYPAGATWLSVDPEGGDSPLAVTIGVDATGLAAGTYTATVTASAPGYLPAALDVVFEVTSAYTIHVSFSPNRSNPQNLNGQVVSGDIYVFTTPEEPEVDFVEFWIDDPSTQGTRHRLENSSPFDLEGGASNGDADPFDTGNLDDGEHTITAKMTLPNGTVEIVHAIFNVLNDAPSIDFPVNSVTFQFDPGESGSSTIAVTTTDATVTPFAVDPITAPWLTVTVLDGTTPGELLIEVDSTGLPNGIHTELVRVTAPGYTAEDFLVRMTIGVPGLGYFDGDDTIDTAVSIVGTDWYINGEITYPGRIWINPANGQARVVEGVMMNARLVQGVYDDLDGNISSSMTPWDPRANTEDFIANMPIWRAHGLLAFNLDLQGGGNPAVSSNDVDCNPYGNDGRRCFDDWYAGLDTPYSQFLVRTGSIIRVADDLGMVVEISPFYWGQDQRLDDNDAVLAAMNGILDWVLENGWTNVLIEVANEASWQPNGVYAFNHTLLQTAGSVDLMAHVKAYTSGPAGAHLPHGRLLTSVSGHGGYVPNDAWIAECDYVIWHGNGQGVLSTASRLDQILARAVYQANPKPIYTNEQHTDTSVIDPHLQRGASWGYHGRNQYQRVFPTTDTLRWTIAKDPNWWNKLAEITGSNP